MLTKLRSHFGIPGILAIAALVFAMIGGAYAASDQGNGGATASAKGKTGKRGPRGPKGATGAAGAQGPAGPAGAKGDTGAQGVAGSDGAAGPTGPTGPEGSAGTSVTVTPINTGIATCFEQGGAKVQEAKVGGASVNVCSGKVGATGPTGPTGSPWVPDNTLPEGATLTGTWSFNATNADGGPFGPKEIFVPISFPIKLAGGLEEDKVHYQTDSNFGDFDGGGSETVGCVGNAENPTAPVGHLCVYVGFSGGATLEMIGTPNFSFSKEASVDGAAMHFLITAEPAYGLGGWAVTGFDTE
jgi:hypothetical protein